MLMLILSACVPPTELLSDSADTGSDGPPTRQWARITPAPCAVDTEGMMACFSSVEWSRFMSIGGIIPLTLIPTEPSPFPMDLLVADADIVGWGTRRDNGEIYVFRCVSGPTDRRCFPPDLDFDVIGPYSGLVDGEFFDWGLGEGEFPEGLYYTHFAVGGRGGRGNTPVALSEGNRLHIWTQPEREYYFPPEVEVETLIGLNNFNGCVLTTEGEVLCLGPAAPVFDNPPYRMLAGSEMAACAARDDWVIECTDGKTYEFGPLRDMTVSTPPTYEPNPPAAPWLAPPGGYHAVFATQGESPHICVITQDNAIRCVGWLYDFDDLQRSLPSGD